MNYQETIDYLYSQLPVYQNIGGIAYKEGLGNSLALDELFDHPHQKYKTIHVGGTNGKGSTSHILASILQMNGYKVGLYTSPHLIDFRERIRVNGEKIEQDYIVNFVEQNKNNFEPIHPSFFELTMTMAFKYFTDKRVDIAIIEVGLGGRLDSTNIISPDLSIITNISLDHIQFLGDTVEKIAKEKAGIIKRKTPILIGEANESLKKVFLEKSAEENAPIVFAEDNSLIDSYHEENNFLVIKSSEYKDEIKDQLLGEHQVKNANTVLNAIQILNNRNYRISKDAVYAGFSKVIDITEFQGRWQIISNSNPKIICDTGHNVAGIKYVVSMIEKEKYNHLHFVIGLVNDKDISHILELLPQTDNITYYFTQAKIARALDANQLKEKASKYHLQGSSYNTVNDSIKEALKQAKKDDLIFIGGSNFVIGEALHLLTKKEL